MTIARTFLETYLAAQVGDACDPFTMTSSDPDGCCVPESHNLGTLPIAWAPGQENEAPGNVPLMQPSAEAGRQRAHCKA